MFAFINIKHFRKHQCIQNLWNTPFINDFSWQNRSFYVNVYASDALFVHCSFFNMWQKIEICWNLQIVIKIFKHLLLLLPMFICNNIHIINLVFACCNNIEFSVFQYKRFIYRAVLLCDIYSTMTLCIV